MKITALGVGCQQDVVPKTFSLAAPEATDSERLSVTSYKRPRSEETIHPGSYYRQQTEQAERLANLNIDLSARLPTAASNASGSEVARFV